MNNVFSLANSNPRAQADLNIAQFTLQHIAFDPVARIGGQAARPELQQPRRPHPVHPAGQAQVPPLGLSADFAPQNHGPCPIAQGQLTH